MEYCRVIPITNNTPMWLNLPHVEVKDFFKLENVRVPKRLIYVVVDIKHKPLCPFCGVNWRTFFYFPIWIYLP